MFESKYCSFAMQGEISDSGTYSELKERGVDFTSLLEVNDIEEDDVFSVNTLELNSSPASPLAHGNYNFYVGRVVTNNF